MSAQVSYAWRSEASHGGWSDANNWWRGYTEAPAGNEFIRFDNNNQLAMTNNLVSASRFQLWFDSGATSARTITGTTANTFYDYGGTAPKIENASSGNHILGFPVVAGYNNFEINPVSGDLTLDRVDLQTYNLNVYGDNGKTLTIRGLLGGSTGSLTLQQNCTVILKSSPTNQGAMTINEGVLQYEAASGVAHTNTIQLGNTSGSESAALFINAAITVGNPIAVRNGSSGVKTIGNRSSGIARYTNTVTLNNGLTISNGAGGRLLLGPVDFGAAQRIFTINSGHTGELTGVMSNDGGNGLVVQGGGELRIGASNTIVGLYVDAGSIRYTNVLAAVAGGIDLGAASSSGDASLLLTTSGGVVTNQIRSRSSSGARRIESQNASGTITLGGPLVLDGAALVFSNASGGTLLATNVVSGTGLFHKVGSGILRLTGPNTYSGTTFISNGVVNIRNANALGATSGGTEISSGGELTLQSAAGTTYAADNLVVAGTGAGGAGALQAIATSSGAAIWSGNVLFSAEALISSATTLTFTNTGGGQTVGGAGNQVMRFGGSGTVVVGAPLTNATAVIAEGGVSLNLFNTNNSYDAVTYASNSVVSIIGSRSLGVTPSSPVAGRVRLDQGKLNYSSTSSGSLDPNVGIELVNYGVLRNAASVFTYGGVIAGSGQLVKEGNQNLILTNANTYSGGTVVTGGTIQASLETTFGPNPGSFDADNVLLDGGGLLVGAGQVLTLDDSNRGMETRGPASAFNINSASATLNVAVAISGTGGVAKAGLGVLILSGANSYNGNTVVAAGTLAHNGTNTSTAVGVAAGTTMLGAGSVGSLSVTGRVSAGASTGTVGNLRAVSASFEPSGTNIVEITAAAGTPGVNWDVLTVGGGAGTLTVNSTSGGGEFVVALVGNPADFNSSLSYTWTVVDAGSVSSYDANKFILNTAGFTPALGGGALSLGESGGDLVISFTPAAGPEIAVFGNTVEIPTGAAAPSLADHTDYGDVAVNGGLLSRIYTITNQGASALTLGSVTTSGTHAAEFIVTNQPASSLAAGDITTLAVQFNPAAVGARSAVLSLSNNDANENPYSFAIQGTGTWAGIEASPSALSVTAMVGDSLSAANFGVTNVGNGTLNYAVTTNQTWLTVSPVSGSLLGGVGQQHTVSYAASGWAAGVSNATITVTDAAASNNPKTVSVVLTLTNIPSATGNAVADGSELVRLGWSSSFNVLLVYRGGAAPSADPTNGTVYTVGDALGGGTVIYSGAGVGVRDHVVGQGTVHHYALYSIHNNCYSPVTAVAATTTSYTVGAIVEPFAYTQTVSLASLGGGSGFTNTWTVNTGTWAVRTNAATPNLDAASYYPVRSANKIELADPGNGGDADAYRSFAPVTSGRIYFSYLMSYQYNGANKYAGLSLMSNDVERAFIGEIYSQNQQLGIASYGGADAGSSFTLAPYAGGGGDTGNVYAVVLRYDFATRQLDAKAFARTTEVPTTEPASWDATATLAAGRMDLVNGIRLAAGAGDAGDGTVGNVYWDELHVATNWGGLLDLTGPILDVAPTSLAFSVNLGQNPAAQTFGVSNSNVGTLTFSNTVAYGSGASGWLTLAPSTGSLGAASGQAVTASVASAELSRGTYTATGTVHAGAAGVRAVTVTLSVTGYNGQVVYDTFNYTALDFVEGQSGGSGWSGSWGDNAGNTPYPVIGSGSLASFDNYCNDGGNRALVDMADCGGGGEDGCNDLYREIYREFSAITSGVVYVGFKLKAQFTGSGKDYGVMLGDGGTFKLKVGKVDAASDNLGVQTTAGLATTLYGIAGADSEYLILARYDFDSREFKTKGYFSNNLGTEEAWESATLTAPAENITSLNRLTLFARNGLSGETAGMVRWDDVRVATTWSDLLCGLGYAQDYPVVTNVTMAATFTDAQVGTSNITLALNFFSAQGVRSDSSIPPYFVPNFDLVNASGVVWLPNQAFDVLTYSDGGHSLLATVTAINASMTLPNVTIGTNYVRWSAITSNQAYRLDNLRDGGGTNLSFTVTDDDVPGPVATLLYVGTNYTPGATSTQVTDGDLVSGGLIDIAVSWSDPSGVWLTNDNGIVNIVSDTGNVWPNWDLTNTLNQDFGLDTAFTNWIGEHGFTSVTNIAYNIAALNPGDVTIDSLWTLTVSAQDADRDRGTVVIGAHTVSVDRAITTNQSFSFSVVDDDTEGPHFRLWTVDGGEEIGYTELERGDLAIIQYYILASAGSEQMHFVSWKSLGVGTVLKMTDWGWTSQGSGTYTSWPWGYFGGSEANGDLDFSNDFVGARTEKNLDWVGYMPSVVTEVQPAGAAYSNNFLFPSTWYGWWSGNAFQGGGDQLFVFQGDWSDKASLNTLYGLGNGQRNVSYTNGFWYADATNHMSSALPPVLTNGYTAMSFNFANGTYTGRTLFYSRDDMLANVADWRNWTGNNLTAQFSTMPVRTNKFELWNTETRYRVTDERMGSGISISGVVFDAYSGIYGISAGASAPTLTIFNASGGTVYGQVMNLGPAGNGLARGYGSQVDLGRTGIALDKSDLVLATYTARVSVTDYDADRVGDSLSRSYDLPIVVVDDDVSPPKFINLVFDTLVVQNQSTNLDRGDIAFIEYFADTNEVPAQARHFGFVLLTDIAGGQTINFADQGWREDTTDWQVNGEGHLAWTVPDGGLTAGTVVTITNGATASVSVGSVTLSSGTFSLDVGGDQVLAYTGTKATPYFIAALNATDDNLWNPAPGTSTRHTSLPPGLTNHVTANLMGNRDDGVYFRTLQNGTKDEHLAKINDSFTWHLGDTRQFVIPPTYDIRVVPRGMFYDAGEVPEGRVDGYTITGLVQDVGSGLYGLGTSNAPSLRIYDQLGSLVLSTNFSVGPGTSGDGKATPVGIAVSNVLVDLQYGQTYTALVVITDYDVDRGEQDWLQTTQIVAMAIIDDDTNAPAAGDLAVFLNRTGAWQSALISGSGSNRLFELKDGELRDLSAATQLVFSLNAYDTESGLPRGLVGPETNLSVTVGGVVTNNLTNFSASLSSVSTLIPTATNLWVFTAPLAYDTVSDLYGATNPIQFTLPFDVDDDRLNDRLPGFTNRASGWWRITDDDAEARPMTNLIYNGRSALSAATTFDDHEGWTNDPAYGTHFQSGPGGTWELNNLSADESTDLSEFTSARRKVNFGAADSYLQLPAVNEPGAVLGWLRNSAGSGVNRFTVDYWLSGGSGWINVGVTNTVSGTNYVLMAFPLDLSAQSVTVRLYAVAVASPAVFLDDLAVTRYLPWTNTPTAALSWGNPTGEVSGIYQYRYTNAAVSAPASVNTGTAAPTNNASFAQSAEGVITGYVFMVDGDDDRTNDRMRSMSMPYRPRVDLTAPAKVTGVSVTNGPDEASEIRMDWLALTDAGNRGDGEVLSPWHTYTVYYEECDACPVTTNSPSITYTNGPADLGTNSTTLGIFSNFNFDANYRLAMAGSDRAGNQGPLSTTVDIQTVNFIVTQGLTRVVSASATSNQVEVAWMAAESKIYDVLYTDGASLQDGMSNQWLLMSTVTNSWMYDNGGTNAEGVWRVGPTLNQHTMRFYRVAREQVWRTNQAVRRASREVYAAKSIRLVPGENWISIFGIPDTSTVAYVLGTNRLQGGSGLIDSPKITWFESGNVGTNLAGEATNIIYQTAHSGWQYFLGGSGSANNQLIPLNQAFLLELPPGAPDQSLVIIAQVPTQEVVQVIAGGTRTSPQYHVLSVNFPQRTPINQAGLVGSGFVANNNHILADEVRILNNRNGMGSLESPKARLYRRTDNTWRYNIPPTNTASFVDGVIPAPDNYLIEPDEAVLIIRRNAGTMYWTNRPTYSAPGKNMNP